MYFICSLKNISKQRAMKKKIIVLLIALSMGMSVRALSRRSWVLAEQPLVQECSILDWFVEGKLERDLDQSRKPNARVDHNDRSKNWGQNVAMLLSSMIWKKLTSSCEY